MSIAFSIIGLLALLVATACGAKAIWHAFGMIRGVRSKSEWWVNLIPFVALALPGALDSQGRMHRAKLGAWGFAACVFAGIATIIDYLLPS